MLDFLFICSLRLDAYLFTILCIFKIKNRTNFDEKKTKIFILVFLFSVFFSLDAESWIQSLMVALILYQLILRDYLGAIFKNYPGEFMLTNQGE